MCVAHSIATLHVGLPTACLHCCCCWHSGAYFCLFSPTGAAAKRWLAGAALSSVKGLRDGAIATTGLAAKGATALLAPGGSKQAVMGLGQCAAASVDITVEPAVSAHEMDDPWEVMEARLAGGASVEVAVQAELHALFGPELAGVQLVRNTSKLDPLVADYQTALRQAAELVDDLISRRDQGCRVKPPRMTVVGPRFGHWGLERYGPQPVRVDALHFYRCGRAQGLYVEQQMRTVEAFLPPLSASKTVHYPPTLNHLRFAGNACSSCGGALARSRQQQPPNPLPLRLLPLPHATLPPLPPAHCSAMTALTGV